MSSRRMAGLIGATFGLVFVLVNSGQAATPWSLVLRVLGVVAFGLAVLLLVRAPDAEVHPRRTALRVYWASVAAEVLAIVVGARVLTAGDRGEYVVAWVVAVVGLHFLPFAWAFRMPAFGVLGLVLVAVAAAAVALGAADVAAPALVAGVGGGFVLLGFGAVLTRVTRT